MAESNPALRDLVRDPISFMAFGFGSGLAPWVPGTMGTLMAVPFYLLAAHFLPLTLYLALLGMAFVVGIYLCGHAAEKLGVHDHGGIVWDEFVGFWLTMVAAPPGWLWVVLGFVLFRFFDMVKPWPIRAVDRRVGGGFGIMIDDVLAGAAAAACLQAFVFVLA